MENMAFELTYEGSEKVQPGSYLWGRVLGRFFLRVQSLPVCPMKQEAQNPALLEQRSEFEREEGVGSNGEKVAYGITPYTKSWLIILLKMLVKNHLGFSYSITPNLVGITDYIHTGTEITFVNRFAFLSIIVLKVFMCGYTYTIIGSIPNK